MNIVIEKVKEKFAGKSRESLQSAKINLLLKSDILFLEKSLQLASREVEIQRKILSKRIQLNKSYVKVL